jgi:outer membrane protein
MKSARLLVCVAACACGLAQAQDKRSTVYLGVVFNNLGDATVDGFSGPGLPPRASLNVGSATALLLNYEFFATPNVGLELATAIGGSTTIEGAGSIANQGRLFKADQFSATAFVNYHFFEPANALRPFLGIGLNRTNFSGIKSYSGQQVRMDNSWGAALQGGARYAIDTNWSFMGSIGFAWVRSDLSMTDATGTRQGQLDFRPAVISLGVGYSF